MEHLLQTAEAIRGDDKPEWMQVRIMSRFFATCFYWHTLGYWSRSRSRKATGLLWVWRSMGCCRCMYFFIFTNPLWQLNCRIPLVATPPSSASLGTNFFVLFLFYSCRMQVLRKDHLSRNFCKQPRFMGHGSLHRVRSLWTQLWSWKCHPLMGPWRGCDLLKAFPWFALTSYCSIYSMSSRIRVACRVTPSLWFSTIASILGTGTVLINTSWMTKMFKTSLRSRPSIPMTCTVKMRSLAMLKNCDHIMRASFPNSSHLN